jgi:mRNA interferase RelE/StbE
MAWRIEFDPAAKKELDKLGHQIAQRIVNFLVERLAPLDNPAASAKP